MAIAESFTLNMPGVICPVDSIGLKHHDLIAAWTA